MSASDARNLEGPAGVGGWLLVLCGLLLGWQPLSLGLVASTVLDALAVRGLPLALTLAARMIVAGVGIAAGLALLSRRASAVALAKIALLLAAAIDVFLYVTPYFPNNLPPDERPLAFAASLGFDVGWLIYVFRSRRVRNTYRD